MRIGIVAHGTETLIRECPGPLPGGVCALVDPQTDELPCAGEEVLLKLRGIGKPKTWMLTVARGIEACPAYLLGAATGIR